MPRVMVLSVTPGSLAQPSAEKAMAPTVMSRLMCRIVRLPLDCFDDSNSRMWSREQSNTLLW